MSIVCEATPTSRLLYMNATAPCIWKGMGKQPTELGSQHRPPRAALLPFGVPFSELGD
jgi:hypothetical protein